MADDEEQRRRADEETPLLGDAGGASQKDQPLYHNLVIGTGVLAQAGAIIIAAIVWGAVFSNKVIFFSWHPIANSAALLFLVQGILVLQPTHTAKQKKEGTYTHAALNDVALLSAIAGLVIIEMNKHAGAHWISAHGILGSITYLLLGLQSFVGLTQYFVPQLYGGVANAKKLYKYHRVFGYIILALMLATICLATSTTFNVNVLHMQLWALVLASVVLVAGVFPRIKPSKFGWMAGR